MVESVGYAQAGQTAITGRRAGAGAVRLSGRDVAGLVLCAGMYGAPYALLAAPLRRAGRPAARDHRPVAAGGTAATGRLIAGRPGTNSYPMIASAVSGREPGWGGLGAGARAGGGVF